MTTFGSLRSCELQEEDGNWNEIENETDIEASSHFIENSGEFVEAGAFTENDILSSLESLVSILSDDFFSLRSGLMMNEFLELIVHHGLEIHVGNIHYYFEGHEMDDAMINSVLVSQ